MLARRRRSSHSRAKPPRPARSWRFRYWNSVLTRRYRNLHSRLARHRLPLLAATAVIAGVVIALPPVWSFITGDSAVPCQQLLIPAYFYPGPNWTKAIRSRPIPNLMILDITSSGAGSTPNRVYQAEIKRAETAGITILGYADTNYGSRPVGAVEADVRHYRSWYDVTSIFLDEVASGGGQVGYYRKLSDYIHGLDGGSLVMLNPGTYPAQAYMSIGDVVLAYEGTYADYLQLRVPGWARHYPAASFAYVIYSTPRPQLRNVIRSALSRGAGYLYVTNGSGTGRYDTLPAYWAAENARVAANCSQGRTPSGPA
jgi:Spherulation-specific family 4